MDEYDTDSSYQSNKPFPTSGYNGFTSIPFQQDTDISFEEETSFENNNDRLGGNVFENQLNPSCTIEEDFSFEQIPTFETNKWNSSQKELLNTNHLYTERLRGPCTSQCCDCCGDDVLCEIPAPLKVTQISQEEYTTALHHITGSTKLRQYTFWYNRFFHTLIFFIVFVILWCSSFIIWGTKGLNLEIGVTLLAIASISVVLICYISCSCFRRKLNYSSKCAMSKANEVFLKYHMICALGERGAVGCYSLNLHFAHYDPGPCMERISQVLNCALVRKQKKRKKSFCTKLKSLCTSPCSDRTITSEHIKNSVIDETDFMLVNTDISESRILEFGRTLLHHYSHRYLNALIMQTVRKPMYSRHVSDKPCLCQYIEREFFHLPMDSVITIS